MIEGPATLENRTFDEIAVSDSSWRASRRCGRGCRSRRALGGGGGPRTARGDDEHQQPAAGAEGAGEPASSGARGTGPGN
jgi:hypothetical protein